MVVMMGTPNVLFSPTVYVTCTQGVSLKGHIPKLLMIEAFVPPYMGSIGERGRSQNHSDPSQNVSLEKTLGIKENPLTLIDSTRVHIISSFSEQHPYGLHLLQGSTFNGIYSFDGFSKLSPSFIYYLDDFPESSRSFI
ncbi:hypothetical protein V6N11_067247 [Hibiscus sabdariffa]|uniref:Uncharacterized protein n=1 Tax=Hibiscus sabdariffa TaxID=183260 RepID=A0ABR2SQY2_9ROSI